MACESFRDFLKQLEAEGELRRISAPVATELEITEVADREMKKAGGGVRRAGRKSICGAAGANRFRYTASYP